MNKQRKIIGLIAISTLIFSIGWTIAEGGAKTNSATASALAEGNVAVLVNVTKVSTHSIPKEVIALGSLSAVQKVTLSAQTDGMISTIYFKNGQEVAKGMPVIQQDNTTANADYQTSVTDLQLSRKTYQRDLQVGDAI